MRIVVNDLAAEIGGALSVLKSFYNYVRNHDSENEYIFLLSGNYVEETDNVKVVIREDVKKSGFHKLKFDFFSGKKCINELKPDYVLSLQNIITFGVKCRQGVYVHQSIPFQKEKKFSLIKSSERGTAVIQKFIGSIIKKSVKKADDVFVQKNWMKENVAEMCKVNRDKISVVPFETDIPYVKKATDYPNRKFFYPATFEGNYKNHECIYQAIDTLQKDGYEDFEVVLTLPTNPEPKCKNITHCGLVEREKLFDYYRNSVILFPSYIETIGLPLLEAKAVNSLILAADCQYSKETLKGYKNAYYFNKFEPNELAELMKKVINREFEFYSYSTDEKTSEGWNVITDRIVK